MLRSGEARLPAFRRRLARLPDERLVVLVRRGNEAAFEELFDRHSPGVLSFCCRFLGSREEGEDAHQHAFLAAYQAIGERGVEPRAFKPWLYAIARNRCLSVLRARREAVLPADGEIVTAARQTAESVEQQAEVRELLNDVCDLPEQQRAAILLSEICDLSHAQVAQVVDCPREKVKSLVFQARASLSLCREARETPCRKVREQLAGSPESRLPLALRRHLKRCEGCSEFAREVRRRRHLMAIALPVAPSIGLKRSTLAVLGGSEGGGAGGGGLAAGLLAKGASVTGASSATAGGGLSAALVAKAGLVAGATAGTALSFAGTGVIAERRQAENVRHPTSSSNGASGVSRRAPPVSARVPRRDGQAPAPERRQYQGRPSEAPARPGRPARAALPQREVRRGGLPQAPLAASAPLPERGTRGPEKLRQAPPGRPQPDKPRGPKRDRTVGGPRPDHNGGRPKPEQGEMTCQNGGGRFVEVGRSVYACVFQDLIRRQRRDQGERTCERRGGLFVDVSPLIYACVLPGGTLPNPFPALPSFGT